MKENVEEQWEWTVGLKEVAGGYFTGRHITNAIRKTINKNEDSRETLLDYGRTINEEIEKNNREILKLEKESGAKKKDTKKAEEEIIQPQQKAMTLEEMEEEDRENGE